MDKILIPTLVHSTYDSVLLSKTCIHIHNIHNTYVNKRVEFIINNKTVLIK